MLSRGAWIFAGLGLAFVAVLALWMGKALDTKAPIRIDRHVPTPVPVAPTLSSEEEAARDERAMRELVAKRAGALAEVAATQVFEGGDSAHARCRFTGARLVHRDGASAFWDAEFACVDTRAPAGPPNLTSVSVHLHKAGPNWLADE